MPLMAIEGVWLSRNQRRSSGLGRRVSLGFIQKIYLRPVSNNVSSVVRNSPGTHVPLLHSHRHRRIKWCTYTLICKVGTELEMVVTIPKPIAVPLLRFNAPLADSFTAGIGSIGAAGGRLEVIVFLVPWSRSGGGSDEVESIRTGGDRIGDAADRWSGFHRHGYICPE